MREIKFRQPLLHTDGSFRSWHYWGMVSGTWVAPLKPRALIHHYQYTGLKNKNGKEIYDGDILKGTTYLYSYQLPNGRQFDYLGFVKWESQADVGLCWMLDDGRNGAWELRQTVHRNTIDYSTGEVIGNTYENPELLAERRLD